jgi:hypothetical protein
VLDYLGCGHSEKPRLPTFERYIDQYSAPVIEKHLVPRVPNDGRCVFRVIPAYERYIEPSFISQNFEEQGTVSAGTGTALIYPFSNQYQKTSSRAGQSAPTIIHALRPGRS